MRRAWIRAAAFAAVTSATATAFADKVAVLPFTAASPASSRADLDVARAATRSAVVRVGHRLPSDSEMTTAEVSVKDGVPDTSEEYRAAGRASSSDWSVGGRVEVHGVRYRLEVEACQVGSGRVESLAREIDPPQAEAEIAEMLALLLRPEGIANADIPWERAAPPDAAPPHAEAPKPKEPAPPPKPAAPPEPPHAYAQDHPVSIGAGAEVLTAVSRPANASGNRTAVHVGGALGYALDAVPGLEIRADVSGAVSGPKALIVDAGARYAWMPAHGPRIYLGPELAAGAFVTLGAEKAARFLARGGALAGVGIGDRVQVEAFGDADVAPGGDGTLVLVGGGARALVRF